LKPNLYFAVNVLYYPDLIRRITIKADTPLDAAKIAHTLNPRAIWLTVIDFKIKKYMRCCKHCLLYFGLCKDYCSYMNNPKGVCYKYHFDGYCTEGYCKSFEPESQTD